jgi:3-hydroxyacyl-CoA dehydrogenase / enoyl-CoA hydratase / 3-hydroxybutyryl-CoA epimerase
MGAMTAAAQIFEAPPLESGHGGEWLDLGQSHWRVRHDRDDVLWLMLDQRNVATNTLSAEVLEQLSMLLDEVARRRPAAIVLRSGKPEGFIVGADINAYREATQREAHALVARAQSVVNAVAALRAPTLAIIHGRCLGGGLQLALACKYRIARSDAVLGLPEVNFGVLPALGGTARLTALVGPDRALELMLTGKSLIAADALAEGLVDFVGEEQHFRNALHAVVAGTFGAHRPAARARALTLRPTRKLIASGARRDTEKRVHSGHHPAPYRLLELWERHGSSAQRMMEQESAAFAGLVIGAPARNLLRAFLLGERLREQAQERGRLHGPAIRHVHVIGAGRMGGGIAAWCAQRGLRVTIEDLRAELLAPAVAHAARVFERVLPDVGQRRAAADRLVPDLAGAGRRKADLFIEAVPEHLELKQRLFVELEAQARPGALFTTNTSAIEIEAIAGVLERPERLAGLHFFNPVTDMRLVEVVVHDRLDSSAQDRLVRFASALDRLPVIVRSAPGFLVNRILAPYLLEALVLLDEGLTAEQVDAVAEGFGLPMGPLELADRLGLDTALDVAESLHHKLDPSLPPIPEWLRGKVAQGDLGVKSGKGFYEYGSAGIAKKRATVEPDPDHVDRLILVMVNAAVGCLAAGIAEDADAVDAAMIFGGGFPAFRGGPVHYARERGSAEVRQRLLVLADRHGERFAPNDAWSRVFANTPGAPPDAGARRR